MKEKDYSNYSVGLFHAWNKEAAGVTGEDNHEYIQKDHIFIGICSLLEENPASYREKYEELTSQKEKSLRAEVKVIKDLLSEFKLNPTELADSVRKRLGKGNYQHKAGANDEIKISRDKVCKDVVFPRAEGLASSEVNCLHFLAALLDESDSKTVEALKEKGVNLKDLKERAIACANSIKENKPPEEIIIVGTGGIRSLMLPLKEKRKTLPEKLNSVEDWLKFMLYVWHMAAYFVIGVVGIGKGVWDFLYGVWKGKAIEELIGHVIWDVIFSVLIVLALTTFIVIFFLVDKFIRPRLSKP